jgi:hypothetical protein
MDGRLVGINTAIFSRSGGSHGIGFAIPDQLVRLVVESAKSGAARRCERPWFGGRLQTVTADIAESLEARSARPAPSSSSVEPNSPADRAGHARRRPDHRRRRPGGRRPGRLRLPLRTRPIGGMARIAVLRRNRRNLVVPLETEPARPRGPDADHPYRRGALRRRPRRNLSPAHGRRTAPRPPQADGVVVMA